MRLSQRVGTLLIATCLTFLSRPIMAQQPSDSAAPHPPWQDSVRYGDGPSVGAPPSSFKGDAPPAKWCLEATDHARGDFGRTGKSWTEISRSWLRQVLSDTSDFGSGWRKVLGGAPQLAQSDSIIQITDEDECRAIAEVINHDILGWKVGPPPVVVFRVRDYLIAYPSNAGMGEFGLAVGMNLEREIRAVSTW